MSAAAIDREYVCIGDTYQGRGRDSASLVSVTLQHEDVAAGLIDLRVQQILPVGREGEARVGYGWGTLHGTNLRFYAAGIGLRPDRGRLARAWPIEEVQALRGERPVSPQARLQLRDERLLVALGKAL